MFTKQTIRNVHIQGKTVLLRAELDAPLSEDGKKVTSDFRLINNIPTIKALINANCKIVLIGKLGRPNNQFNPKMSLAPVAKRLQKLLGHDIEFVKDCIGEKVYEKTKDLKPKQIVMLENI